ncbi:MAG: hypothetical protein M0P31_08980 [Solirubrobacteraceae bacterium]|nr:hypothetical protein [Solirubrobacteraceae bacterium]
MALFSRRPDVSLDVSPGTVVAGEAVRARVTFGAPDAKTRGGRVELLYHNTYREEERDDDVVRRTTIGDRTHTQVGSRSRTVTTTSPVVVVSQQVPVEEGTIEVDLPVPPDAPGTTSSKAIAWEVRAIVDRKLGIDAVAKAEVTVLTPPTQHASWASSPVESTVAWALSIEPASRVVRAGDEITGHLRLTPAEALEVRAIRVQLRRVRFDPDRNTTSDDGIRVELAGRTTLVAGQTTQLPFSITVPGDADPTFRAEHNHHHWYLEGVLDQRLAKDPRVTSEIVVHTG